MLALVEKHFGDIPARPTPARPSFAEPLPGTERRAVSPDAHAPLPALAVGYRLPDPGADLDAYLGHALLGSILGDGEAARLQRRLVHVDGLVTDVSASAGLMGPLDARDPDTFTITAVHPPSVDPDRVLAAVDEELDKLAAAGPGADELARQVARWSAALHHEDDRVMYRMLGLGARELLYGRAELALELPGPARGRHPRAGPGGGGRAARAGACGADRRTRHPAHRGAGVTVTVSNPAHRSAEEIGRTTAGPRPLPPLGSTREVPLPDVLDVTLATGLRVLVARNPSVPMAELRLRVPFAPGRHGDAADDTRSPATSPPPSCSPRRCSPAPRPGTASRSTTSWPAWARTSASPSIPSGSRSVGPGCPRGCRRSSTCSRTCSPAPCTRTPRWCASAAGSSSGSPSRGRSRARSPARRCSASGSAPTPSRGRCRRARTSPPSSPRTSARCTRAGLVPGGAILTLVGDLDPHDAVALVEQRLGGWTAAHPARRLTAPPPVAPSNLELVPRAGSVQSQLRMSAPALPRLDARYAALQLANLVFGGYFSSRWMENIREDKGYTYGAHSGTEFVPGGAVLSVETDVASDVTAAALLETRYELGRMVAVPPTADEIDAARRYAVGSLLISLDSQGGYASTLASLAADDVSVQWLRDHPARLEAVTVEEVAAAAGEFFAPSAFTGVIVGDADVIGPGLRALGGVDLP